MGQNRQIVRVLYTKKYTWKSTPPLVGLHDCASAANITTCTSLVVVMMTMVMTMVVTMVMVVTMMMALGREIDEIGDFGKAGIRRCGQRWSEQEGPARTSSWS